MTSHHHQRACPSKSISAEIEKLSSAKDCETVIHMLDREIQELRRLKQQAHDKLAPLQAAEQQNTLRARPANFPKPQGVGV